MYSLDYQNLPLIFVLSSGLIPAFMLHDLPMGFPVGKSITTLAIYNLITNHGIKLNIKKITLSKVILLNLPLFANLFSFWPPVHHCSLHEESRVHALLGQKRL